MELIIKRSKEYWNDAFKKGKWDRLLDLEKEKNTAFIAEILVNETPQNGRILDLGAGNGALARAVLSKRADLDYFAVDISKEALDSLKASTPLVKTIECDLNDLSKINLDKKFDFIVLCEIFYYVNPIKVFRQIKRFENKNTRTVVSMYKSLRGKFLWFLIPFWRVKKTFKIAHEGRGMSWTIKILSN